jgi:hypothetical protein
MEPHAVNYAFMAENLDEIFEERLSISRRGTPEKTSKRSIHKIKQGLLMRRNNEIC